MTFERSGTPIDGTVSPYLRQPLRTLERARQDRDLHRRSIADAEVKTE